MMTRVSNIGRLKNTEKKDGRLWVLTLIFFLLAGIIIFRLFTLQVVRHGFYIDLATRRNDIQRDLLPYRGSIYVKENNDLYPVVTNKDYYLVFADPREVVDKAKIVDSITPILGLEEFEWKKLLGQLGKKNDPYEPIKQKVPQEKMEQIKALNLPGIYFTRETFRYYPEKNFSGHILGFVGYDENSRSGKYGIEGFFNDKLEGRAGNIKSLRDARGNAVTLGEREVTEAMDGMDIILSIDRAVQNRVCQILSKAVKDFEADGGTVIVQEPFTGEIISMCNIPDFDPELYNEVDNIDYFNNSAIVNAYEPGSVFKIITMATGLDLGEVTPETTYEDTGEVKLIGHNPIRNSDLKSYGQQTMVEVLEKSLNTGVVFVVDAIGKKEFKKYVQAFGFGEKTGIRLNTENAGNISSLEKHGQIYSLTASFGQGITATPLQLITAFSAVANGGKLMRPYIVDEVRSGTAVIEKTVPHVRSQVIKSSTAAILNGMLVSVVENGWGEKAKIDGYYFAGKTGTAQVADETGKYGEKSIHTFIGYGPASKPKFTILVKLDNPQLVTFSSDSSTPVFRQIAEFLLQHYQIEPER